MASFTYNTGALGVAEGTIDFETDVFKIALIKNSHVPDQDETAMTDIAADEISVTGYVGGFAGAGRKTLASCTITQDDVNNRIVFDATDPSAWTLSTGATIGYAVIYKHDTNDATSIPLFLLDLTDTPTNGGTFTVTFPTSGIAYLQG